MTSIDCSGSAIKIVTMAFTPRRYRFIDCHRSDFVDVDYLERVQQTYRPQALALCAPSSAIDIRYFSLPPLPKNDLRKAIGYEVERSIDYPIEESCFDYTLSHGTEGFGNGKTPIVAFVCRKTAMQTLLARMSSPSCHATVIDTAPMALMNLYREIVPDFSRYSYLGVNVAEENVTVVAAQKGLLTFTRNFPIPVIPEKDGMENPEAVDPEIVTELQRTVHYCASQYRLGIQEFRKILLSGAGAFIPNRMAHIEEALRLPCEAIHSVPGSSHQQPSEPRANDLSSHFSIAAGLAFRLGKETA